MADDDAPDLDDLGEPIAELRELRDEPPSGFVARLLDRLRRRDLSRQLTTLGWTGFAAVLVEFLKLMFSMFETSPRDEGGPE